MVKPLKVLFISAPIGAGHIRAAQAVRAAMQEQSTAIETELANVFDFFSPWLGKHILKMYLTLLAVFPQLYGIMYRLGNETSFALLVREVISRYLAERMYKYILSYQPTVIVCTHATPAGLVAYLCKKNKIDIPVYAIITDYIVHRLWIYPEIDYYFVAHQAMREELVRHGVGLSRSQTVGIPVAKAFTIAPDTAEIYEKLGLCATCKTVLIMGGGAGVLPMDELVLACDALALPLQIIVVAGNNKAIYEKLQKLKPKIHHPIRIVGFVQNIHELMTIADILISKPGGMTVAEALCLGLPMIIYRPIPGQEVANTKFLTHMQVVLLANSIADVQTILFNLCKNQPEKLQLLRQKALALGQPQAVEHIVSCIFSHFSS